jgi:beta-galactosidase
MRVCLKTAFIYTEAVGIQKESTLHILPHWNGEVVKGKQLLFFVHSFSAELFYNGKSMGSEKKKSTPQNFALMWMDVNQEQ